MIWFLAFLAMAAIHMALVCDYYRSKRKAIKYIDQILAYSPTRDQRVLLIKAKKSLLR